LILLQRDSPGPDDEGMEGKEERSAKWCHSAAEKREGGEEEA